MCTTPDMLMYYFLLLYESIISNKQIHHNGDCSLRFTLFQPKVCILTLHIQIPIMPVCELEVVWRKVVFACRNVAKWWRKINSLRNLCGVFEFFLGLLKMLKLSQEK